MIAPRRPRRTPGEWRARFVRALPVLLLLSSLGVAGLGALHAYRAQRSHRATADALITDYGAFVAWSYADKWTGLLNGSLGATLNGIRGAVAAGRTTEECLETLLATDAGNGGDCGCGMGLAGPASWAFLATYGEGAGPPHTAGAVPAADERDRVVAGVVKHARTSYRQGQMHALITLPGGVDGEPRAIAYTRVARVDRDTVVYGIEVDAARLRQLFDRALDRSELLPPSLSRGEPNRSLVAVTLTTADGALAFRSAPASALSHPAEQRVPEALGGGAVQASVLPQVADQLIIGGLPRNRLPLLLGILALSGVLAFMAVVQLRRENQLARMRSDFVASVSHELRSPLAQVRLFVETLRLGRAGTEEHREWALANIDRETLRLAGLVENVLAFSRAERGGLEGLELQPTDVGAEVAEAAEAFAPLVPPGRMTLEVEAGRGLRALVHADTFRQVVLNLLDNAVKYGPRGQTVGVETSLRGQVVRLAVEDQGPGVPADERELVFQPFCRGRSIMEGAVAGSGIGLAVVREIVRAHGGRVWVEDAPAGGARFVVELPRVHTAGTERLAPGETPAAPAAEVA